MIRTEITQAGGELSYLTRRSEKLRKDEWKL